MTTELDPEVVERAGAAVHQRWPAAELAELTSLTGHSGLTLGGRLDGGGSPGRVVLKLCPPGRPASGRHDVIRQASLLAELAEVTTVAVPEVLLIDDKPPPAVVLSWVEGEAAEPVLEMRPGDHPAAMVEARARSAARMLAALHRIAPEQLTISATEKRWGPADELARWEPTMATVAPELRTGADRLLSVLHESVPAPGPMSIIHGDYRLGNLIANGDDIRAIIDWEIWSVGDPRVDLGWFLVMCEPSHMPGIATPIEGMPTSDVLFQEYGYAVERPVPDQKWFDAAARFKMAAIMGNNLHRHRTGRKIDPYQERLVTAIPELIRQGNALMA